MGQASVPIVASRKTIERPAGLNCNFVHRQFLIERIFYNDMPVFDFSFPFHSFPMLATSAASIGKGYPFRKIPVLTLCVGRGFSLVGIVPNPFVFSHSISRLKDSFCCTFPLTIYNTALSILPKRREKFLKNYYFSFCTQSKANDFQLYR